MNLEQFQFVILGAVVAMAAYVGTVAREVFRKIGQKLKINELPSRYLRSTLWSLIVGDILLIAIANLTALRIFYWSQNKPISVQSDQQLVNLILITVLYMSLLHAIQWVVFAVRASAQSLANPKDE